MDFTPTTLYLTGNLKNRIIENRKIEREIIGKLTQIVFGLQYDVRQGPSGTRNTPNAVNKRKQKI